MKLMMRGTCRGQRSVVLVPMQLRAGGRELDVVEHKTEMETYAEEVEWISWDPVLRWRSIGRFLLIHRHKGC